MLMYAALGIWPHVAFKDEVAVLYAKDQFVC